jgi:hypothetical protein
MTTTIASQQQPLAAWCTICLGFLRDGDYRPGQRCGLCGEPAVIGVDPAIRKKAIEIDQVGLQEMQRAERLEREVKALRAQLSTAAVGGAAYCGALLARLHVDGVIIPQEELRAADIARVTDLSGGGVRLSRSGTTLAQQLATAPAAAQHEPANEPREGWGCGKKHLGCHCDRCRKALDTAPSAAREDSRPCPVPNCHAGMLRNRNGRDSVSCPVCDGAITAEQYRTLKESHGG